MTLYILCKLTKSLKQFFIPCVLAVVTGVAMFGGISYADLTEMTKLAPEDGEYADFFGSSVSISGNYAIVGAPNDDEMFRTNCGSVYIFQRSANSWIQMGSKLIAQDGAPNDAFGSSVSINGEYAIVGAPFHSHFESYKFYGAAYIFKLTDNVWQQVAKLSASDKEPNDYFGSSVAISGDFAIVGMPLDDDKGNDSGSAYIFQRSGSTWSQVEKLSPAELSAGDHFGNSVAINGDDAVVGAPRDDNERGSNAGSIYIFKRSDGAWSGWRLNELSGDGADDDEFGWSVSIDGHFAVAGAHYHDGGEDLTHSGSARIFQELDDTGLWGTLPYHRLIPSDTAASDEFGFSVSISSECAVVGTLKYINGNGTVYVFRKSTDDNDWPQLEKLIASDGSPWGFGCAVSISGRYAIVGAKQDINTVGSAYVYDIFAGPSPPHSGTMPAIPLLLLDD